MNTLMNDHTNGQPLSLEARVSELERELQALKASLKSGSSSRAVESDERGSATGSLVTPKWIGHNWLKERIVSKEILSEDPTQESLDDGVDWSAILVPVAGAVYGGVRMEVRVTNGGMGMKAKVAQRLRARLFDYGVSLSLLSGNLESDRYTVGLFSPGVDKIPVKVRATIVGESCGVEVNYWRVDGKLVFQPVDFMNRPIDPEEYGQPQWCARLRDAGFVWDSKTRTFSQRS